MENIEVIVNNESAWNVRDMNGWNVHVDSVFYGKINKE